jgi:hypothetical protein
MEGAREERVSAHRMIFMGGGGTSFANEGLGGLVGMCVTGLGGLRRFAMLLTAIASQRAATHTFTEVY